MQTHIYDCLAREVIEREMTVEEQAALTATRAEAQAMEAAQAAITQERQAAATDLVANAATALARLDAIIATGGTFSAAQVRDAVIDLARIQRRVLRRLLSL